MRTLNILLLFLSVSFSVNAQMMPQPYKKKLPNIVQYRVEKVMDSENKLFKKNDALYVSLKDGLRHYRNGRLINTYKIIPDSIKRIQVINCHMPPCPPLKITEPALYVESLKRYLIFFTNLNGNTYLKATPVGYNVRKNEALKEEDISLWYVLKIINGSVSGKTPN